MENMNKKLDIVQDEMQEMGENVERAEGLKTDICGIQDHVDIYNAVITYDKIYVETNEGNGRLDDTGRFTAGKEGVYLVTATAKAFTEDNAGILVFLKTSTHRYQEYSEDLFLFQYSEQYEKDLSTITASRYVYLSEGENIFLHYICNNGFVENNNCVLDDIKYCIGFYSERANV